VRFPGSLLDSAFAMGFVLSGESPSSFFARFAAFTAFFGELALSASGAASFAAAFKVAACIAVATVWSTKPSGNTVLHGSFDCFINRFKSLRPSACQPIEKASGVSGASDAARRSPID
jgi:hypothetical protein